MRLICINNSMFLNLKNLTSFDFTVYFLFKIVTVTVKCDFHDLKIVAEFCAFM